MDDFVMEIPGAATPEFCQMMIDKYENDHRKLAAMIGPDATVDKNTRDSLNLEMNLYPEWKPIVDDIRGMIYSRLTKYLDDIHICLLYTSDAADE